MITFVLEKKNTLILIKNCTKIWINYSELIIGCFKKFEKNIFISNYQIIIFHINIMESTCRSRSRANRQKVVVIKSRSRSPMNVDTQNSKLKNATKKINLSNSKEESKSNYYKYSKSEGDWDISKLNNDESPI